MNEPTKQESTPVATSSKLPLQAHLACGWPLVLVFVGGAIGGGLGGMAYAINMAVYRSQMPLVAKVLSNLAIGFVAIALWMGIILAIKTAE